MHNIGPVHLPIFPVGLGQERRRKREDNIGTLYGIGYYQGHQDGHQEGHDEGLGLGADLGAVGVIAIAGTIYAGWHFVRAFLAGQAEQTHSISRANNGVVGQGP
jgi:hypothetical protein